MKTKKIFLPCIAMGIAANCLMTGTSDAAGVYANQQLMVNPFMNGASYTGWSPTSPWRNNGGSESQVFDFETSGSTGFFSTSQATNDIKTVGAHTTDVDYLSSTARLTAIQFDGVFLNKANEGAASSTLDGSFFIEFDITTATANYRAKSIGIEDPWAQTAGAVLGSNSSYTWETGGGFSGDPFAGSGLVLDSITAINAKYFMNVVTNNNGGTGPVFSTIDNASIQYEVTVVPEPSSVLLLSLGGLALVSRRKR